MADIPRDDQDEPTADRNPREGIESPPELTEEDEAALDRVWARIAARRNLAAPPARKPGDDAADDPGQDRVRIPRV